MTVHDLPRGGNGHDFPRARDTSHGSAPAVHIDGRTVLPVLSGDRPLGVYVIGDDGVRWYRLEPDRRRELTALAVAALAGAAMGLLAARTHHRAHHALPGRRKGLIRG